MDGDKLRGRTHCDSSPTTSDSCPGSPRSIGRSSYVPFRRRANGRKLLHRRRRTRRRTRPGVASAARRPNPTDRSERSASGRCRSTRDVEVASATSASADRGCAPVDVRRLPPDFRRRTGRTEPRRSSECVVHLPTTPVAAAAFPIPTVPTSSDEIASPVDRHFPKLQAPVRRRRSMR